MRKTTLFLLGLLISAPLFAQVQYRTFDNDPSHMRHATLKNGMEIYLLPDANQSGVYGGVVIKAGGKYDPKDATGMGHYLEHMLFKGTESLGTRDYEAEKAHLDKIRDLYDQLGQTEDEEQRKAIQEQINTENIAATQYAIPNEFDRLLSSIGATGLNAFTAEEMIMYYNYFPGNQMEKWLDIYAERFKSPVFRLFQSELETVYEEKNRAMDDFVFPLFQAFQKNFYKVHPYGQQTIIGETEHLKNPSLTKMYAYFDTYYVANNMALILCGNFNPDKTLPMIQEKFGSLRSGDVPAFPVYEEAPFEGRESFRGRYTPVAAGLIGFRTPPQGHPDEIPVRIATQLLSNYSETGHLNRLNLEREVLFADLEYTPNLDYGQALVIFAPKLIGQSLKKGEEVVLNEVYRIGEGDFEDWQLEAVKLNLLKEFQENMESTRKAFQAAECFISGKSWDEVIQYPEKVQAITRAEVIAAAKKYFGPNYFILESKMGFPKKDKLDKPGFEAPEAPKDTQSEYAKRFNELPEAIPNERYVDFEKDLTVRKHGNYTIYHAQNPVNDLFKLELRFHRGTRQDLRLKEAAQLMYLLGTDAKPVTELKKAFSLLGCSYEFSGGTHYTSISLSGFDRNFSASMDLLAEFLREVKADEDQMKTIRDMIKTERKEERKSVSSLGRALFEKVRYGDDSNYLNRLSYKDLKDLSAEELVGVFQEACQYLGEAFYSGTLSADQVEKEMDKFIGATGFETKSGQRIERMIQQYDAPTVYFIPRKDAIQSQLYFYRSSSGWSSSLNPKINAFNEYFGGGMSSLVFQEIREYRSLAYSTRAFLSRPAHQKGLMHFWGFLGCQGDKTPEAIAAMTDLITNMPDKEERLPGIKKALVQSSYTSFPNFRYIGNSVWDWQRRGYSEDPNRANVAAIPQMTWSDIRSAYVDWVQPSEDNPLVITVVGDPRRISSEELEKYGKVVELKVEDILTN